MNQTKIAKQHELSPPVLNKVLMGATDVSMMPAVNALKIAAIMQWPLEKVLKSKAPALKKRYFQLYEFQAQNLSQNGG